MSSNFEKNADEWISQAEAARLRGISRQAIADLVKRERVATFKIGGRILVSRKDVLAFSPKSAGRPRK